jgi:hypothetical protein
MNRWSRREMLRRSAALGAIAAVPANVLAQAARAAPYANLSAAEAATIEALVARLIPSDANGPGALEAGAARYIDGALGNALAAQRPAYAAGLAALDSLTRARAAAHRSPRWRRSARTSSSATSKPIAHRGSRRRRARFSSSCSGTRSKARSAIRTTAAIRTSSAGSSSAIRVCAWR